MWTHKSFFAQYFIESFNLRMQPADTKTVRRLDFLWTTQNFGCSVIAAPPERLVGRQERTLSALRSSVGAQQNVVEHSTSS